MAKKGGAFSYGNDFFSDTLSLGFARSSMESAILLEVQNLCEILDATQEPIGKVPFSNVNCIYSVTMYR